MFDRRERQTCPICGVTLVGFAKLPPPSEPLDDDGIPEQPEYRPLPVLFLGRGRGLLAALAIVGLVAFTLPWVRMTVPDIVDYTGFALARRLGWTWGAGVAWFVLLPTVVTRRSIVQMRGARVAAAFLAAFPGVTAAILLCRPPHGTHAIPLRFTFGEGLYATLALSAVGVIAAMSFGGRLDDIRLKRGTSSGHPIH